MWRFLRNRRLILRLYYFQGTHILGASRGDPCVSVASCFIFAGARMCVSLSLVTREPQRHEVFCRGVYNSHILYCYSVTVGPYHAFTIILCKTKGWWQRTNAANEYGSNWERLCDVLVSAVAMIADRTAYDVRYSGKLSNRFWLQVYQRLVRTIRFNG